MYGGVHFTSIPRQRLQGKNTSMGIGLVELIEPSDALSYKSFLNPNLGWFLGLCFEVGVGGKSNPLSKTCYNYARNLKIGT